ncbi:F-box/WD repeat-containing protein 9 [Diretmus argenteus]
MSEVRVDVTEQQAGTERVGTEVDQDQDPPPPPDPVEPPTGETSWPDLQDLLPGGRLLSTEPSPSPSAEGSGLLSLPWEMVTHIASHLPAQCVITVLPKVCHVLGNLGKDSTAWQLRARRLTGSRAGFPVGPKEDFDWPNACLEMEQLITCWAGQADLAKQAQGDESERGREGQQHRAGEDGELDNEGQEDGREDVVEGVGVAAQEVAFGVDEVMELALDGEDGDIQQNVGGDVLVRVREELEERPEEAAAALMLRERGQRAMVDVVDGREGAFDQIDHQEDLADPRHLGDRGEVDRGQSPRSPSPPPALERMILPSGHIAQVNSVLLVGNEGTVCATGSRDWNVKLWDLQVGSSGTLLHTLGGQGHFSTHRGWVWCLAYRGPLLASGGFDSTVRLWDLEAGGAERGLIRARAAVLCLSCQTDVLLAGTFDKRISMYDTRVAEPLVKSLRLHSNAVMCLAADDNYIISGSKDCTVAVYDRRAGKPLKKLRLSSYLLSMSYSGSEVWAGDNRGMLHAFSMQAGVLKLLSQFDVGHTSLITGIHRSPGSLYTCSSDRTVKVHLPSAPPRTLCTLHHQDGVNGLSVEAGVLAVASGDMCVEVWRPRR